MKDERTQKTRINLYTGQCLGKKGENLKIQKNIYICTFLSVLCKETFVICTHFSEIVLLC